YANTMPSKKTPQKKSHFTKAFPILVFAVAIALAGFLGYKWYAHQSMLTAEKKSFETLRTDMKSLQAEFNKIDPGWEYSEGCHGNGQEIRYTASSCFVSVYKSIDPVNTKNIVVQSQFFDEAESSSFIDNNIKYDVQKITYRNDYNFLCDFITSQNENDGKKSMGFNCSRSAHQFYFDDKDK
ncbi:MAG: hypothetical protein WBB33_02375, partial [Candidatus Saccharimonadales bacterium]